MDDDAFAQFAKKYRGKFRSIAAATRRELEPDDVMGEAWLLAKGWELAGTPIGFNDTADVDKLFSHLYQKFVNYTDKNIRNGVRLDHWTYGDNPETDSHPLMNLLAAAEGDQPLEALLATEAVAEQPPEPGPHETRASAYLFLMQRYDNCMRDVARHLMISLSYCYYRLNEAREMVSRQRALPDTVGQSANGFIPGPWRSFRLIRPWVQMELDLTPTADLWAGASANLRYSVAIGTQHTDCLIGSRASAARPSIVRARRCKQGQNDFRPIVMY